jgi:hypothetical protein
LERLVIGPVTGAVEVVSDDNAEVAMANTGVTNSRPRLTS